LLSLSIEEAIERFASGPSIEAALYFYRKSAELGEISAWSGLGYMYMQGEGVEPDIKRAF